MPIFNSPAQPVPTETRFGNPIAGDCNGGQQEPLQRFFTRWWRLFPYVDYPKFHRRLIFQVGRRR